MLPGVTIIAQAEEWCDLWPQVTCTFDGHRLNHKPFPPTSDGLTYSLFPKYACTSASLELKRYPIAIDMSNNFDWKSLINQEFWGWGTGLFSSRLESTTFGISGEVLPSSLSGSFSSCTGLKRGSGESWSSFSSSIPGKQGKQLSKSSPPFFELFFPPEGFLGLWSFLLLVKPRARSFLLRRPSSPSATCLFGSSTTGGHSTRCGLPGFFTLLLLSFCHSVSAINGSSIANKLDTSS